MRVASAALGLFLVIIAKGAAASSWVSVKNMSATKRKYAATRSSLHFRETIASEARSLTDGVALHKNKQDDEPVILPWVGYGTYRLGKNLSEQCTLQALECGYRCIDTAFIYGGETTETNVGKAIQSSLRQGGIKDRKELFVITKHWRSYHGYEPTLKCLEKSLKRLQLQHIDLWLMHWPGPAYNTMNRRKDLLQQKDGVWKHYSKVDKEDMAEVRAETWRAMEDAYKSGKVRAIGVSNFSIAHLETLKRTATVWPPAVNQVECHALYPQDELLEYCAKEGIVVQAYAALGGQDATKKQWRELLNGKKLLTAPVVVEIASQLNVTPAQVLLRYSLQRNCAVTPKSSSKQRMEENANVFHFSLTPTQMTSLNELAVPGQSGRLCWRNDPLRLLEFE